MSAYSSPDMKALWHPATTLQIWHDIERAVLRAQAKHGLVPEEWALEAEQTPPPSRLDWDAATLESGHEVVGYLRASGLDHIHIGLTSSDLTDTALALRVNVSTRLIHDAGVQALAPLARFISQHEQTPMLARTHGQPAVPDTLGRRFDSLGAGIYRCLNDLEALPGKISGPVGSHRHPVVSQEVELDVLESLGLDQSPPISTQIVPRDYLTRWVDACARIASSVAAVGLEVRLMSQHGIEEMTETHGRDYQGSSAMPHKNNPYLSERLAGLARLVRSAAGAVGQGIEQWGCHDLAHSSVERELLPQIASATETGLHMLREILDGLQVNQDRLLDRLAEAHEQATSHDRMVELQLAGTPYTDAARLAATTKEA